MEENYREAREVFIEAVALGTVAEWSRMADRRLEAGPGAIVHGYDDVDLDTTLVYDNDVIVVPESFF